MSKEIIEDILKEKEKTKKRYKWQAAFFTVALSVLSFFFVLSFYEHIHYIAFIILLLIACILLPLTQFIIFFEFVKKEKHLKFVNFFLSSNQYILNLFLVLTIYFHFYFKTSETTDLNAAIAYYSISWSIFGIAITLFGVWLSINSKQLLESKQSDDFNVNHYKYNATIGSIFTFISLIINLILLLSGVSYFSGDNYSSHSAYYIGLIYISSYFILNMMTSLFLPTILEMADNGFRSNKSLLEYLNDSIKIFEETEKINETITALNRLIETAKKIESEKEAK